MLSRFLCAVLIGRSLLSAAFAYGNAGHETVGNIATHLLTGTRAEKEVAGLLTPGEDLGRAATWADRAKIPDKYLNQEMKDYVAANPAHHTYHYCDIPFQEKTYRPDIIGANPQDIVHTMQTCIQILQNPSDDSKNPLNASKRIALRLLTHFVGDLHQPLHVGCGYVDTNDRFVNPIDGGQGQLDAGANYFRLNTRTTLHGFWDTATVKLARDHAASLDFTGFLQKQNPPTPDWKVSGPPSSWPTLWANDTLKLSAGCYQGIKIVSRRLVPADEKDPAHFEWVITLAPGYDLKARDIVELQLSKAGFRLAELLKAIWPGKP